MSIINVILSGGVGSRLWPLSRKSRPKQYIPLFDGLTLFQMCIERNHAIADTILVVGGIDNYKLSRDDFKRSGISTYVEIVEASPRNTAASIAFAAFSVRPDDILIVTPSDHIIAGKEQYEQTLKEAVGLAEQGYIVTFGAVPTRPETGYGYIEHDTDFNVISFKEKPELTTAESYLDKGNFLWNAGLFCFKASVYLEGLKKYAPEVYKTSLNAMNEIKDGFLPLKETMEIPSISVDYAVMEHSQQIKVMPFHFDWSDLGSFESMWEYLSKNNSGKVGKNLVLGSKKHVEFIGLENLILVETDDAILVMPKDKTQDVKKIYERLEKENPDLVK